MVTRSECVLNFNGRVSNADNHFLPLTGIHVLDSATKIVRFTDIVTIRYKTKTDHKYSPHTPDKQQYK